MPNQIINQAKKNMDESLDFMQNELRKFKTGRAQSALVEDILVEYYGTKTPLKQIATISVPEPAMISISPFDKNSIKSIEKAISESKLNLTTSSDGQIIRIKIPPLTEERRQELAQVLNQKVEEVKVSIRSTREETMKKLKDMESAKQISEDEKFKTKEDLDKLVDEYNKKIEDIRKKKEEEILTV
ncbi:MAG: ribosome recycling factor [Patescibacteria group bacterium]|jgi:ribosome recycling factor